MDYAALFPDLPDHAHLWAHVASRPLRPDEEKRLRGVLDDFMAGWTSHGRRVEGAFRLLESRILLVGADLPGGAVSGCGIDKLVRRLERGAEAMGFAWASPLSVFYRDAEGAVQSATRPAFRALAAEGTVTTETPVFDLGVALVGDLRAGGFEKPAGQAWHARAFPLPAPAA